MADAKKNIEKSVTPPKDKASVKVSTPSAATNRIAAKSFVA